MFRAVGSRLFRNALQGNTKRIRISEVENTRLMSSVAKRPQGKKPTFLAVVHQIKPKAYVFFAFPLATFALGAWQIKRSIWKNNIIKELESRVHRTPVPFPETIEEISKMEYHPVRVRGQFDHSREILLGPRTLLNSNKPASTLLSDGSNAGFFVFTPFKLSDRDYSIWVNRGWVSVGQKNAKTRQGGQIEGEIEFTGLIRLTEKKPQFVYENDPNEKIWLYRNLEQMSAATGEDVAPISIDATADSSLPDGPIGGQTLINIRNTHYNYAITWLSLSLLSGIMWYQNFIPAALRRAR